MAERVYALIGDAIRKRRDGIGMSQEALGSRIGLSRASVTNIESGRHPVSVHHLYGIAGAFGVRVCDLLPDAGSLHPPVAAGPPGVDISELLGKLGRPVAGAIK